MDLPIHNSRVPHFCCRCRCWCCWSCCCCGCSRKSTPRCPCLSRRRSPRLLSTHADWPVFTPGLFTPYLTGVWVLETLLHTDLAAFPYLGMGWYSPVLGHYILARIKENIQWQELKMNWRWIFFPLSCISPGSEKVNFTLYLFFNDNNFAGLSCFFFLSENPSIQNSQYALRMSFFFFKKSHKRDIHFTWTVIQHRFAIKAI